MSAQTDFDTASLYGTVGERKVLARCHYLLKVGKAPDKRFRKRAIEGVSFYFDDQWEATPKQQVIDRGQQPVVMNGVKPVTRVALGLMLAQPMDWVAKPVGDHDDEVAESANAALKYVANRNHMPSVLKRVYFWALTYGVGWVHVGPHVRTTDPRQEVCQVRVVDPREIRLDPQSIEPDLSDARFLVWSRKVDLEEAKRMYPKAAQQLELGERGDPNLADGNTEDRGDGVNVHPGVSGVVPPPSLWDSFEEWNQFDQDVDKPNKQVVIHSLWEVKEVPTWFYEGQDGQPCAFEAKDKASILLNPAVTKVYQKPAPKVFAHVFCGPLLLETGASDRKHNRIPFLPCFFERDQHGDPVSFIESLKQTQREVNYRRAKMLHALGNPPYRVSPEVLGQMGMTHQQFADHIGKPGAVVVAEPNQIEILRRDDQASQQFQLLIHGEEQLQKSSGANDNLMGYGSSGANVSGKSKELSMQQGATMQRDSETNLRDFHKHLGELVLQDIQQEHSGPWLVRVTDDAGKDKWLTLNTPQVDPQTGLESSTRTMSACTFELEVDNSPWSPTMRSRASDLYAQMAADEQDPILKHAFHMAALQVSDFPGKAKQMQAIAQAQQQAQQAQQNAPRVQEQLRLTDAALTPFEVGQVLKAGYNIQPDPSRQPGQPSPSQMKAQGQPAAPPTLDPNKVLDANTKVTVAHIKHAHDAQQASIGRTHDELMMLGGHEHQREQANRAHIQSLVTGGIQHQQGLDAASHAAELEPDPVDPAEAQEPAE